MKYILLLPLLCFACKKETLRQADERIIKTEQLKLPPWGKPHKLDSAYLSQLFKRFGR